jgi:hypothetical protein
VHSCRVMDLPGEQIGYGLLTILEVWLVRWEPGPESSACT